MGLRDLTLTDGRRLLMVAADLLEGKDGPSLTSIIGMIRAAPEPRDSGSNGFRFDDFRNPPSPSKEALVAAAARIRSAVVNRYGEEYARDLWERVRK